MILVTGAQGQLSSLVLADLRARGLPVVGGSRAPSAGDRHLDFDAPDDLDLHDVTTLVLVSAGYAEDDRVVARHAGVVDAAARAGVGHVVYTSLTGAGDHLGFALAHRVTERIVQDSGLAWTVLRNGLYAELVGSLMTWDEDTLESPFGDGAVAAVARRDLAEAAAVVAADPTAHHARTYELVGEPVTTAAVARRLGVQHASIALDDYRDRLLSAEGLLPFQPPMLASIASSVRHGLLGATHPDLSTLLGRPPADAVAVAAEAARRG
jgi:NAD(P)H dehydrogenase (quinone)